MVNLPLFLSDVAGSEILLILLFILIFFGANSIPGIARTMGRTIRQIKDASEEVQNEIRKSSAGMKNDFDLQRLVDDSVKDIEQPFHEQAKIIDESLSESGVRFQAPPVFIDPLNNPHLTRPLDQLHEQEIMEEKKDR